MILCCPVAATSHKKQDHRHETLSNQLDYHKAQLQHVQPKSQIQEMVFYDLLGDVCVTALSAHL